MFAICRIPTIPAHSPVSTYTLVLTWLTGTPESAAARSLLPMAYSQRPKGARVRMMEKAIATATITHAEIGAPRGLLAKTPKKPVLPSSSWPRSSLVMLVPSSSTWVRPRPTYNIPSVTMNGARFSRAINKPLTQPTSSPTATAITTITQVDGYMTASVRGRWTPWNRVPATAPVSPTVEPTERSMPEWRITISIPRAMMALNATSLATVTRLPAER